MRLMPGLGAAAFGLILPALALAQPPAAAAPPPSGPANAPAGSAVNPPNPAAPPGTPAPGSGASAAAPATLAAGTPVKDKNGTQIGQVASVKTDASGKQTATIRMGADSFAVDTAALAVDNSGATINATQAEIRQMMKQSAPKK